MYRSALAHRDLRLLLAAMLVSMAGSWAYNVALLAVVYERTESLAWVGAATLGRFIPQLLVSPYAGVVADRFERVRVMVSCDLIAASSQAALALVVLAEGPAAVMIALAAVTAVAMTPFEPAVAAVTPQIVDDDHDRRGCRRLDRERIRRRPAQQHLGSHDTGQRGELCGEPGSVVAIGRALSLGRPIDDRCTGDEHEHGEQRLHGSMVARARLPERSREAHASCRDLRSRTSSFRTECTLT